MRWTIDFEAKKVRGSVEYTVEGPGNEFRVDTSGGLTISKALVDGEEVAMAYGPTSSVFGTPVAVPLSSSSLGTRSSQVKFEYETGEGCTAAQWLDKEQTGSKRYPFFFTQCQAIHARSLLPCQDAPGVKFTWDAIVEAPEWSTTLASALLTKREGTNKWYFEQPMKTSTYLVALVCGELSSLELSPRCRVWAEPGKVDLAALDFQDTEKFLSSAEKIAGIPYAWSRYDLVVLPASFPYGGMENPQLTTVTPTVLAGDKSLAGVVAHEIAHSWTGNLVTNATWQAFFLNEGWTRWFERQIRADVDASEDPAEQRRIIDFDCQMSRGHLKEDVAHFQDTGNPNFTALVPDLTGVDPDDAFSSVPYEKGSGLMHYLEHLVGSKDFLAFFQHYLRTFQNAPVTPLDFQACFEATFPATRVDFSQWFADPGYLPQEHPLDAHYIDKVTKAAQDCLALLVVVVVGKKKTNDDKGEKKNRGASSVVVEKKGAALRKWPAAHLAYFLDLLEEAPSYALDRAALVALGNAAGFSTSRNYEIKFRWAKVLLKAGEPLGLDLAVDVVTTQGRMKFTRPLYRAICAAPIPGALDTAVNTFETHIDFYHPICRKMVAADLQFFIDNRPKIPSSSKAALGPRRALLVASGLALLLVGGRRFFSSSSSK